ncbi:MAG: hypothetical protein JSV47_08625 [Deltaproteobacteria bacterium]|jgi:uncharacterized protein (TIGR02001 family)|nr:MAG: hypothetical protein JSV47_08625 [Deltaproteobacteria bacterium]
MKKKLALFLALLVAGTWSVAFAQEGASNDDGIFALKNFGASVALTTDYVFRGISQTDENPAIQGSFDYKHPVGVYLGAWASNVDDSISKGNIEIDYYGGFRKELFKDFTFDVSLIYYSYPSGGDDPEPDFIEGHLGLSYVFANVPLQPTLGVGYNYSPDFFGEDGNAHYLNGTLDLALPYHIGLGFEVGYQDVEGDKTTGNNMGEDGGDGFDYIFWRVALSYEIKGFGLDLSYYDTNEDDFLGDVADSRVVFSVSRAI